MYFIFYGIPKNNTISARRYCDGLAKHSVV
uniref:Uncharacterized protein n=1 Tax=Anguilla anguilla TaxID=7936 RepID=A0A0E9V1F0_ANGAN